jgi:multiple sugar transport system permease protein
LKKPNLGAYALAAPVHVLLAITMTIPAIYIFWLSLNESTFGSHQVFVGLDNYARIFADPAFWRASWNTFIVVNSIVYIEILLATLIAALFASGVPLRPLMIALVLVPYSVSEVVTVLVWKSLMNPSYGVIGRTLADMGMAMNWSASPTAGLTLVALISIWQHLPFSVILIYAGMTAIPDSLYEAAEVDGAGRLQAFWRVTLPLLLPTLLVALIFRFIFAFRLFTEVWLLTGGGPARTTEVLGVYLYRDAYRDGAFGTASATGWIMVVGTLLIASLYLWLMQRSMRRG